MLKEKSLHQRAEGRGEKERKERNGDGKRERERERDSFRYPRWLDARLSWTLDTIPSTRGRVLTLSTNPFTDSKHR